MSGLCSSGVFLCLQVLVWSVVGHVNIAVCVFVLASGLNLDVRLFDCIVLMPPVLLVMTVPISIGGWGVRENAMVLAFGLVGMSQQSATVLGLLLGFMTLAIALPGGLIWLASRGKERSRSITDIDGELTATPPEEKPVSLSDLNPMSILFTFVTFGVSTLSIG